MEQKEVIRLGDDSVAGVEVALKVPVTSDDNIYGPSEASITLVEYGEFECPECGRAHFKLTQLRDRLHELDARFVFRHFARDDVHPFSVRAALTAEAAGVQGRFWEMHDHLFRHQHSLEHEDLRRHATEVGLDVDRFLRDLRDPHLREVVERHRIGGVESGVVQTPTFFLNGRRYDGSNDIDPLVDAIRSAARRLAENDARVPTRAR